MKKFQEIEPVRFFDERFNWVIDGFVQLKLEDLNQEELKLETELKALVTNSWSLVLQADCTCIKSETRSMVLKIVSIFSTCCNLNDRDKQIHLCLCTKEVLEDEVKYRER